LYSCLGFEAKRLIGEPCIREADGEEVAPGRRGLTIYAGPGPRTMPEDIEHQPDAWPDDKVFPIARQAEPKAPKNNSLSRPWKEAPSCFHWHCSRRATPLRTEEPSLHDAAAGRAQLMLRAAVFLSFLRRLQRFSTSGHPEVLVACYAAAWPLPRPDFHRLADDSFQDTPPWVMRPIDKMAAVSIFISQYFSRAKVYLQISLRQIVHVW